MTYKEEEEEEDMTYILMGTTAPFTSNKND